MSKLELMRARLLVAEADKAKKNTRKANKENEKAGALGTEKKQEAGQKKHSELSESELSESESESSAHCSDSMFTIRLTKKACARASAACWRAVGVGMDGLEGSYRLTHLLSTQMADNTSHMVNHAAPIRMRALFEQVHVIAVPRRRDAGVDPR
ncbi:hypothetical protein DFH09DRAFT_1069819 [Mycena vulgaris]|nr:hypothetical protein DFH09DRAFT_1069819 [Mycena vulgaris]